MLVSIEYTNEKYYTCMYMYAVKFFDFELSQTLAIYSLYRVIFLLPSTLMFTCLSIF